MRAFEFLIEASGIRAARQGEVYTDQDGVEFKFQKWNWQFPADADQYTDMAELEAAVLDVTGGAKDKIFWTNAPSARLKSFGFAEFKADDGTERWIGKFFSKKNPNNTIADGEIKTFAGLGAGGADKATSAAVKSEAKLKPAELGVADGRPRAIKNIMSTVASHANGDMLTSALSEATKNVPVTFVGGAAMASAIQDDFCEVLAPVAMISGHNAVIGQLDAAVADVFKGGDLQGANISFPVEQNNPLVDSYIIKNGISLGVSHKGKTGAKASITNIWKAKEEAAATSTGRAYLDKFPAAVEILDICKEQNGIEQAITLGAKFGILSASEARVLTTVMQNGRDPQYRLTGNPANPNAVVKTATAEDAAKVPPALKRLFDMGGYKAGSYVGFSVLARVAKLTVDKINSDPKIDFGEAIRSFLNSSAMVQATSVVSTDKSGNAVLTRIGVAYPPNFQDKAKIEASGYYGTEVKGKFSFSLPKT